jgi:hypothetical protein
MRGLELLVILALIFCCYIGWRIGKAKWGKD